MRAILTSIFFMPGVIIHELSHHIFCIIFSAKVIDVCYYNFRDASGYVIHEQPKHLYQNVLISTAPFLINSFIGGLVSYPTMVNKLSKMGLVSLNWHDFLRIIISISIGMNAIPSKGDGLSIWKSVGDSDMNFLLKLSAKIIITPLVLIIFLINFGSSFLKIDLLYGVCICFIGPKLIENIFNFDISQNLINSLQNINL
ncbi:metalloprotease family protein [Prochlorococcus sp. AH-716-O05]|nr:metalloprotease family protein [Prochlorococcus sp. AH-716-O05]